MYVKVRTIDGKKTAHVLVSKLSTIEEVRKLIQGKLGVAPELQRLFYRGKQLEDGYKLFDYSINLNDVIQVMIRPVLQEKQDTARNATKSPKPSAVEFDEDVDGSAGSNKENDEEESIDSRKMAEIEPDLNVEEECESEYYKIGDKVDCRDPYYGAWFEGTMEKIEKNEKGSLEPERVNVDKNFKDDLIYYVRFESYDEETSYHLILSDLRPRSIKTCNINDLKVGDTVLANYSIDNPLERGFWYDCTITDIVNTRTQKEITATVYVGELNVPLEDCKIKFWKDMMIIEKPMKIKERCGNEMEQPSVPLRESAPRCPSCRDIPNRKCKDCGCQICNRKEKSEMQLMCDECDLPYHIYCLNPPLESVPTDEEWYCPECKNDKSEIVAAGEKLKTSKKRMKMASSTSTCTRNWGKGFACAGRTKVCTITPPHHFGPIPGVEVGTLWKFRLQVSEAGVHRPHVAGMHGTERDGAYSIVLSGGYEDDIDEGDEFTYSGSGGRDLSGNKRTAEQSCDQKLTRTNKALALNCNARLDAENGAEAKNWKAGKPVRVVRNYKFRSHSKYAPEEGNRYDGIYKVVKYWPESGKSGFLVWRYLLRRDDPVPAPWTKAGKARIKETGIKMIYPDGYIEALSEEKFKDESSDDSGSGRKGKGRGKRTRSVSEPENPKSKRAKTHNYEIEEELQQLIKKDELNAKLWEECHLAAHEGKQKFLSKIEDLFTCICCQEVVCKPITTACKHNICQSCLKRSFKAEVTTCPCCRFELGENYELNINEILSEILVKVFPGYDADR